MATIARLGIDTSKSLFQLHGVDEREEAVLRKQVRRGQFLGFVAKLAPTKIGVEACGASHYWARRLQALGHEVVLLPPQHVHQGGAQALGGRKHPMQPPPNHDNHLEFCSSCGKQIDTVDLGNGRASC